MTVLPVATDRWYQPRPPFTVDTLFELPDSDLRYEALGGNLIVSPLPTFAHNFAADRLRRVLLSLLPINVDAVRAVAVRMPNGDGPVPDLVITTADPGEPKGLPADKVHTVVEVVSPSSKKVDRQLKTELYGLAGIPCYWRVELRGWPDHLGPVPAIVVRFFDRRLTTVHLFAAGEEHEIPLVIGPGMQVITVPLDPATLTEVRR